MWNVGWLKLKHTGEEGKKEGERDGLEEREKQHWWKREMVWVEIAISEINTWLFLETERNEQINCQSRFGWFRNS